LVCPSNSKKLSLEGVKPHRYFHRNNGEGGKWSFA